MLSIHEGNKAFECETCDKSFSKKAKGLMEQSNREVMVHSFLPARSSYLRFTSVDRSVNENNHILIYVVFRNTVLLFYILHCSFNIF